MTTQKPDSGAIADAMIAHEVERYTPKSTLWKPSGVIMDEMANGAFVHHDDYLALEAKLADAEASILTMEQEQTDLCAQIRLLVKVTNEADKAAEARTLKAVEAMPVEPIKCWSFNEEEFNYQSLDDLIDSNADELKVGQTVWFADAVTPAASRLIDADDVMTTMGERADDIAGEYAEGYPDVSKEAEAELDALLRGWIDKHATPPFWVVVNVKPYVLTAEDLADAAAIIAGSQK